LGRRICIKTIDARNLERAVHLDYHRVLGDLKGVPYADFPSGQIPMSAFGGKADITTAMQKKRRAYQPNDHLIRGGWSAWSNRIGGHDRRFRTCVGLACTLAHRSSYYRSCSSSVRHRKCRLQVSSYSVYAAVDAG